MHTESEVFHSPVSTRPPVFKRKRLPVVISAALGMLALPALAATPQTTPAKDGDTITVSATPQTFTPGGNDAVPAYLDGQIANGARLGILGEQDAMNVPFNVVSFTDKLMQDQQTRTLGDVLNNDAAVQTGYGYGNYSETFVIRGFELSGDDISYGGLYGVLPRQLLPTNLPIVWSCSKVPAPSLTACRRAEPALAVTLISNRNVRLTQRLTACRWITRRLLRLAVP